MFIITNNNNALFQNPLILISNKFDVSQFQELMKMIKVQNTCKSHTQKKRNKPCFRVHKLASGNFASYMKWKSEKL